MAASGRGPFGVNQQEKWRMIGTWASKDSAAAAEDDVDSGKGVSDSADSEILEWELKRAKASLVSCSQHASAPLRWRTASLHSRIAVPQNTCTIISYSLINR